MGNKRKETLWWSDKKTFPFMPHHFKVSFPNIRRLEWMSPKQISSWKILRWTAWGKGRQRERERACGVVKKVVIEVSCSLHPLRAQTMTVLACLMLRQQLQFPMFAVVAETLCWNFKTILWLYFFSFLGGVCRSHTYATQLILFDYYLSYSMSSGSMRIITKLWVFWVFIISHLLV